MSEYGTAWLKATYDLDGNVIRVDVENADDVIGVSVELLDEAQPWVFPNGDKDMIQLDTAGEYVYRYVRPADDGRVRIYERSKP